MIVQKTVLVVEDERLVARDLQRTLQDLGYRVPATAASADDALRIAADDPPDLVLMDVRIEGDRDGIVAAQQLRAEHDAAIVFITAYADGPTISRAKVTEPHGYLVKPIKDAELRSAVEIALYKKEMERQVHRRERWYSTTLRSIADGVITTDVDERVTFLNRAAEELTGWSVEEALGRPLDEVFVLVHESTQERIASPAGAALRERCVVAIPSDALLRRRDGVEVPVEDGAAPIVDDRQTLAGAVVVFRDAREKRELQSNLLVADRMVSVGLLAAGVAHEINNPLAAVVANVDLATQAVEDLRSGALQPDAQGSIEAVLAELQDAKSATSRIRSIVRDLNLLSRSEEDVRGPVDVHEVMESSLRIAHHEVRHRAQIIREYGQAPLVEANESRLGQVFLNVIVNAAQAIAEGHAQNNEIRIVTGTDETGHATVEIHDTGPGMEPAVVARLFQPFFTTKPIGVGTGLGLALCRRILTGLRGSITVDSKPGVGTVVSIRLPPAGPGQTPRRRRFPSSQ